MNSGRTVFAQLVAHLSHIEFQKCVARYDGDQLRIPSDADQRSEVMAIAIPK